MGKKGTNHRRFSSAAKTAASWAAFLAENRFLILFSFVFLAGAALGVVVYAFSGQAVAEELGIILSIKGAVRGFKGCVSALFSSCFPSFLLLALLFLCGLSACGAPLAAAVPLFFGMGLGLTEGYYGSLGIKGFLILALLVVPHYLIAAAALLFGAIESLRLSVLISRQLLPGGMMGGLWQDFKIYCLRFLAYTAVAFASGVADVCLRLLLGPILLK